MINLFIVPVRQYAKGLSITLFPSEESASSLLFKKVGSNENLEDTADKLLNKFLSSGCYELEFHKLFQPNEVTKNIAVVYRAIHVAENHCDLTRRAIREVEVQIKKNEPVVIKGFDDYPNDKIIAESVINEMSQQMLENIDAKSNKKGFKTMLSLLPNVFDSRELGMAYYALTGKTSSVKMLSNSLLDNYVIGSREPRTINGRNLIEEYQPVSAKLTEAVLDEKYSKYKTSIKAGPKAKTLFKKKVF